MKSIIQLNWTVIGVNLILFSACQLSGVKREKMEGAIFQKNPSVRDSEKISDRGLEGRNTERNERGSLQVVGKENLATRTERTRALVRESLSTSEWADEKTSPTRVKKEGVVKIQLPTIDDPVKSFPSSEIHQNKRDWFRIWQKKIELNPKSLVKMEGSEEDLYKFILHQLHEKNENGFWISSQLYIDRYLDRGPHSVDVLYLQGVKYSFSKNYAQALRKYNQILQKHRMSPRIPSTLLAKGSTLQQMNLNSLAQETFLALLKKYPLSSEARSIKSQKIMQGEL